MDNQFFSINRFLFAALICWLPVYVEANQDKKNDDMTLSISATHYGKMPLLITILDSKTADTQMLVEMVRHDLTWSGQFEVTIEYSEVIPSKQQLLGTADRGFPLMLFVQRESDGKSFVWRLYDTTQPAMVQGKRLNKKGADVRVWAHELADMLWPVLTGQEGFFSTKVAYCKEVKRNKKRPLKYLCVADYDGSNEQVKVPTLVVAPRWGKRGLLFYSECTNHNVRLMYMDLQGSTHVVSNFDGLNMLPSFSYDGTISVYCASRGRGSCQIYYCAQGVLKQLTHNDGNNVSPTITADGKTVYFCSDYKTGKPAIYSMDIQSGSCEEVIHSGLCPSYSERAQKLVFIKNIKGTMQLCVYDLAARATEQLTYDAGDKDECSWSTCGNYIFYSVARGAGSRIGTLNIISREIHWITQTSEVCTYPAPSPFDCQSKAVSITLSV